MMDPHLLENQWKRKLKTYPDIPLEFVHEMQGKLKPCPFCGQEVKFIAYNYLGKGHFTYAIEHRCDYTFLLAHTMHYDTLEEVVAVWNHRAHCEE